MNDVGELVQHYLQVAATETDKKGRTRSPGTMTNYKRALEGLVAAMNNAGLGLEDLPEGFIEQQWMTTQQSVVNQPIQLRVRVGAVKQFMNWLFQNGIPCAPVRYPEIKTPTPKPKEPQMNDVTMLSDATMQADPVPSTQTYVPPPAPQVQTVIPPPQPKSVAPKPQAVKNPLTGLLPTGQYKLRVRREREMDEPVWVGDFPADRVAAAGAVEPFLGREVAPRMVAQGITGDVTFIVSSVGPNNQEVGERNRMTISCVPAVSAVQSIAAPVAGAPQVTTGGVSPSEMADMLAYHRKAQEELEERLAKKFEAPKQAPIEERKPVANEEMNDLKQMVASLAGSVRDLSMRLEDRDRGYDAPLPTPATPAAPQMDMLGVIREVMAFNKQMNHQPPAPVQQPMDLAGVFNMMAQAKQMFAPAQVNIDVSPLEERMDHLQQQLAASTKKKDEITEMVEKFKALKELFGVVGGETSASKPTNSLGGALGSLLDRVVNNPAPLADAVERILNATAQMKAAGRGGPAPQAPQPHKPQLPPQLLQATEALLGAESPEATTVAAHEWLSLMTQIPPLQKTAERVTTLLREGKATELTIVFRQVFTHFGFGEQASAARVTQMVKDILAQVAAANEEAEEEDEEGDEEQLPPDLTVRVGGAQMMAQEEMDDEEADEEGDEEASDDEDYQSEDEDAAIAAAGPEDVAAEAANDAEAAPVGPPIEEVAATMSEIQEVLAEETQPKKPRRKRRTKAEMAAARAAEILEQAQVQKGKPGAEV